MNENDPFDWLIKADRDINLAKLAQSQMAEVTDLICYHCQQAAEKYLKALVVRDRLPLRKTHDLEELLDILSPVESAIDNEHYNHAIRLKIYAVGIRYPSRFGDPTGAEALDALSSAVFFQNFAKKILEV